MGRKETVELTNMCMVEDGKGNVLVQNRLDPNWPGIVYPGGHVEAGESITASVVREVREETGLTVQNPTLCGVKQFWLDDGVRYIVFLFRADKFTGELHGSEEGDAFWLPRAELFEHQTAESFEGLVHDFMTPHNEAKKGDIAKVVLMPGDPLRAKFIAETFLENAVCFNTVRGMLGYTGLYNGKRVSVMGSGMGMPSMGIYSYELYHCYDVEAIIRIGTAGGIADGVELRDLVLAMGACTDSNFAHQYRLPGTFAPTASFELLEKAVQTAREKNLRYRVGNVVTSDIFYGDCENETAEWKKMGVLAVEMETAALYMTAARAGKQALSITTVSDLPLKGESTSSEERQKTFTQMMEVALTVASEAVDGHDK